MAKRMLSEIMIQRRWDETWVKAASRLNGEQEEITLAAGKQSNPIDPVAGSITNCESGFGAWRSRHDPACTVITMRKDPQCLSFNSLSYN